MSPRSPARGRRNRATRAPALPYVSPWVPRSLAGGKSPVRSAGFTGHLPTASPHTDRSMVPPTSPSAASHAALQSAPFLESFRSRCLLRGPCLWLLGLVPTLDLRSFRQRAGLQVLP